MLMPLVIFESHCAGFSLAPKPGIPCCRGPKRPPLNPLCSKCSWKLLFLTGLSPGAHFHSYFTPAFLFLVFPRQVLVMGPD